MTVIIKYNQLGVYAEECSPLYAQEKKMIAIYENKTDNFRTIMGRDAKLFIQKIEEIHNKLDKIPTGNTMVTGTFSNFSSSTIVSELLYYFPRNNSISFLKENQQQDFLSDKCYIDINSNSLKTLKELGYEEGDVVYLENYPKINRDKIKEILSDKYDYTFFQDKDKLQNTIPLQSASGLEKIIASIPTKSIGGNKTYINRRRRQEKKKEKLEREKKEKQGNGKNLVELKR